MIYFPSVASLTDLEDAVAEDTCLLLLLFSLVYLMVNSFSDRPGLFRKLYLLNLKCCTINKEVLTFDIRLNVKLLKIIETDIVNETISLHIHFDI